jgi:hypothetical protein
LERKVFFSVSEHLITSWRAAWGYMLPFFWVNLHPWGPGGGTHGAAFGDDGFAITQIRLAQNLVEKALPMTGQVRKRITKTGSGQT